MRHEPRLQSSHMRASPEGTLRIRALTYVRAQLPSVPLFSPRVPGGGSGTTATGQPTASRLRQRFGRNQLQANDDGLLCKGTGLDPGPSHVHGGNLFCERRAHPIEIHIARNCAYVACVDGPNQRGQFIQRPSHVADPDQADNNEGKYCLAHRIVPCGQVAPGAPW